TVRAQKLDVFAVRLPITEAARPDVMSILGTQFRRWVDMVYIERPKIIKSAPYAFTAEFRNKFQLASPITAALMRLVALSIPVGPLTVWRAKARARCGTTLDARTCVPPS